ncbi:MAG: thiamine biosynthesis protein ThiS [Chloroflexi bacterium RBG_16_51_9]|nr:MAG: thiamine biosynthesis protein ThiS [Chloroflexi bacterium RBG_16_51_9]
MLIKIGGAVSQIPDALSIQELLQTKNLSGDGLIIVVNGDVIKREDWKSWKLNPNDSIEIIRMVFGG